MCNELRTKEVENSSFRKILITRCQQEFEKNKDAETNNKDKKIKEIESQPDPVSLICWLSYKVCYFTTMVINILFSFP